MSAKLFGLALRLFSSSFSEQAAWTRGCPSVSARSHLAAPGGFEQHLLVKWDLRKEISGPSSPWHPVGEAGAFLELSELPQLCPAAAEPFPTRSFSCLHLLCPGKLPFGAAVGLLGQLVLSGVFWNKFLSFLGSQHLTASSRGVLSELSAKAVAFLPVVFSRPPVGL